jgi:hypothetical protein
VRLAASVFARTVINAVMTAREFPTDRDIAAPRIRHERGAQIDVGAHDRSQGLGSGVDRRLRYRSATFAFD